jgi:geranylgeranylglycerol-phosphate geranylgeranyltransferase
MKAYLELIRPSNSIMAGFAVFLSGMIATGREFPPIDVFFAVLGTISASSGGMVINDYFDYDIDIINRPDRVLPRGALSKRHALLFAVLLFSISFLFIGLTNPLCIGIGYPALVLIVIYSWRLKRLPFIGNIVVAFLTSLTLIYGGAAAGTIVLVTILAICAFFANLSREIVKDIEDIKGDKQLKSKTFPIVYGISKSLLIASIFLLIGIITTFLPYFSGLFGRIYLLLIMPVDAIMLYMGFLLARKRMDKISLIQRIEKAGMYAVLCIFFVSKMVQ